jgi:LPPG:FO 2-phospho-L-lactate transferase
VIDNVDQQDATWLQGQGLDVLVTPTLMKTSEEKTALLTQVVEFALSSKKQRAA